MRSSNAGSRAYRVALGVPFTLEESMLLNGADGSGPWSCAVEKIYRIDEVRAYRERTQERYLALYIVSALIPESSQLFQSFQSSTKV